MYLLFLTLLYLTCRCYRKFGYSPSFFILLVYLISSIGGIIYYYVFREVNNNFLYNVYYIINLIILLIPLVKYHIDIDRIEFKNTAIKYFSILLIVLGVFSLYSCISDFNLLEVFYSWSDLRNEYYSDYGEIVIETKLHARIASNFLCILPLSIPLGIYYLVDGQKMMSISLLVVSLSLLLSTIMKGERQGLLEYMSYYIFSILLFKDIMSSNLKKKIFIFTTVIISSLTIVVGLITISRFEDRGILESLFNYSGIQLYNANDFLEVVQGQTLNGALNFSYLTGDSAIYKINEEISAPFYLNVFGGIVGSFYLDFGYATIIFTSIFAYLFCTLFKFFYRKKSFIFFYLYFIYFQIMFVGVFYFKHTSHTFFRSSILFAVLIVLLEFIFKKRSNVQSINNSLNL